MFKTTLLLTFLLNTLLLPTQTWAEDKCAESLSLAHEISDLNLETQLLRLKYIRLAKEIILPGGPL